MDQIDKIKLSMINQLNLTFMMQYHTPNDRRVIIETIGNRTNMDPETLRSILVDGQVVPGRSLETLTIEYLVNIATELKFAIRISVYGETYG